MTEDYCISDFFLFAALKNGLKCSFTACKLRVFTLFCLAYALKLSNAMAL